MLDQNSSRLVYSDGNIKVFVNWDRTSCIADNAGYLPGVYLNWKAGLLATTFDSHMLAEIAKRYDIISVEVLQQFKDFVMGGNIEKAYEEDFMRQSSSKINPNIPAQPIPAKKFKQPIELRHNYDGDHCHLFFKTKDGKILSGKIQRKDVNEYIMISNIEELIELRDMLTEAIEDLSK
jgi:hypothetical protein